MRAEDAQVGTCVVLTEEGRTYMADKMAEWSLEVLDSEPEDDEVAIALGGSGIGLWIPASMVVPKGGDE